MRKSLILATALIGTAIASSSAFAAEAKDTGVIKAINARHHELRLSDHKWYIFPSHFSFKGVKLGRKVTVTYDVRHGHRHAQSLKFVG